MFEEIQFNHFFMETKEKIEPYLYKFLNPYTMRFYKTDGIYFALIFLDNETVEVCMTVGEGPNGFRDFFKACDLYNVKLLKFVSSEHNKRLQTLYKYVGAVKKSEIPNFYSDNSTGYYYELDIINSKRLKKSINAQ